MLKVAKIVFHGLTEWGKKKIPISPPILSGAPGNIYTRNTVPSGIIISQGITYPGNILPWGYCTGRVHLYLWNSLNAVKILPWEHCSCCMGTLFPREYFTLGILYRLRTLYILPWEHCSWAWLFGCYKTTLLSLYNCVSHFTFIIHFYFYHFPFFHFFLFSFFFPFQERG